MTVRFHLFPFRTQQLSSLVPKIVSWKRLVKIGSRRLDQNALREILERFLFAFFVSLSIRNLRSLYVQCSRKICRKYKFFLYDTIFCPKTQQKSPEISLRAFCSSRRLPIFTRRFQRTIFGTSELNFCVRNGNRWNLTVIDTDRSD